MHRFTNASISENGSPFNWSLIGCLALIVGNICFFIGIIVIFTENSRIEKMNIYNERTHLWNKYGISTFEKAHFNIDFDKNHYIPLINTYEEEENYPVRDTCDYIGDPGCIDTHVYYYYVTVPINKTLESSLLLYSDSKLLVNATIHPYEDYKLTKKEIGCEGADRSVCVSKCLKNEGVWNDYTNRCHIQLYINHICYRFSYDNQLNSFQLDLPPIYTLSEYDIGEGCDYSNGYFNSKIYEDYESNFINITMRYYIDPYITASSLTEGCSNENETIGNTLCFGSTKQEQDLYGFIGIGMGSIAILIELICIILAFSVYKNKSDKPGIITLFSFNNCNTYVSPSSSYHNPSLSLRTKTTSPLPKVNLCDSSIYIPESDDETKKWLFNYYTDVDEAYIHEPAEIINGLGYDKDGNLTQKQYIPPNAPSCMPLDSSYDVYISGTDEGI